MAKKSKIDAGKQVNGQGAQPVNAPAESKTLNTNPRPKRKKAASRKQTVRGNTASDTRIQLSTQPYEPSDEEVRIRAYFIAERRIQLSLEGSSDEDWLEAKRQLVEEATRLPSKP